MTIVAWCPECGSELAEGDSLVFGMCIGCWNDLDVLRTIALRSRIVPERKDVRRFFIDTEFYEDGKTIDLISIAIVRDDGEEFYACNREARLDLVGDWHRQNVLPHLPPFGDSKWMTREQIARQVKYFVNDALSVSPLKPEFWAYFADYDWVVLCQLFGTMMNLPKGWPMYCKDLKQRMADLGVDKAQLPAQEGAAHDAPADARWVKAAYDFLKGRRP